MKDLAQRFIFFVQLGLCGPSGDRFSLVLMDFKRLTIENERVKRAVYFTTEITQRNPTRRAATIVRSVMDI